MFEELHADLEGLAGQYEKLRARIGDVQQQVSQIRVTVEAADGAVKATADYRGRLVGLELNPRTVRGLDSRTLAAAVVTAAGEAAEQAAQQAQELFRPLMPDEFAEKLDLVGGPDLAKLLPRDPLGPIRLPGGEVL